MTARSTTLILALVFALVVLVLWQPWVKPSGLATSQHAADEPLVTAPVTPRVSSNDARVPAVTSDTATVGERALAHDSGSALLVHTPTPQGAPIADADVTLIWQGSGGPTPFADRSDANGVCRVPIVAGASSTVRASHAAFADAVAHLPALDGGGEVRLRMLPAAPLSLRSLRRSLARRSRTRACSCSRAANCRRWRATCRSLVRCTTWPAAATSLMRAAK